MDNGSARRRTVNTAWRSSGQKPASNGHIVCGIGSSLHQGWHRQPGGDPDARLQFDGPQIEATGSTELSARLDPEDLREVIAAYHLAVADIVRSFDGFVAKYMGDGVLVYLGYPRAHEDDAERAVRANSSLKHRGLLRAC
jgi:hypothetical protein